MKNLGKRHQTGINGENLAAEFIEENGYSILHRRYRCRNGEIDIIAEKDNTIVFVEIKTVHENAGAGFGEPEEKISVYKQNALRRCAEHYLWKKQISGKDCRFDLITVRLSDQPPNFQHLENIIF